MLAGHDSGASEPRPFPPPLPRRFRPGPRLRRPSLVKALLPPLHIHASNDGGPVSRHQDAPSAPDPKTSQDTEQGRTGIDASGSDRRQNASTLLPAVANANRTLATNGTGDQESSPAATVLSASTIWTLALCAAMIVAAVAFFAVVLAVCRCRQRRERRKKYLTTQKNIRVMQNVVKMAARKKKETLRQGPFGRSSIA
ncbi:hypothetical protein V5799_000567 [Amblyomma americanum]|uniref:Uncharacterized protein n=1 Tax=Amblyomma americanum TaxID=6943 RepID=A0AAQ4D2P0_AMBAM